MALIIGLAVFLFFLSEPPPKVKRAVSYLLGAGWLALLVSDYGVLTGYKSTYYPGKFTTSGRAFESVRCAYWIGFRSRYVEKAGAPGSISCPLTLHLEHKWKTKKVVSDSGPAVIVTDQ